VAATHRFFVPPGAISGSHAALDPNASHQVRDVLRLRSGDEVLLLDDSGWEFRVRLEKIEKSGVSGIVLGKRLGHGEPGAKIVLYQSLLKGSKFEWVLQKCTEAGVTGFVPIVSGRSIPKGEEDSPARRGRWQRIIQEAAEQSRRSRLPSLQPVTLFSAAMASLSGRTLIAWEDEDTLSLNSILGEWSGGSGRIFSINLIIGPEGGFGREEIDVAKRAGAVPVSLGPRILRADTAGLVASSVLLYALGELTPAMRRDRQ
jgi:16S rRNA (uracil1498-N3)-methyltransferase